MQSGGDVGYTSFFRYITMANKLSPRLALALLEVTPAFEIPRDQGFLLLRPSQVTFFDTSQLLSACDDIIINKTSISRGKSYLKNFLTTGSEINGKFIDFALDPTILRVVQRYLGELPVLNAIKLLHSVPSGDLHDGSQLFHCDHDDTRQVKIFLHVSDVDIESGPLTVIPSKLSSDIRVRTGYVFGGRAGHLNDDVFQDNKTYCEAFQMTGKRGSLAFVDTANCFHFGGRVATNQRYILYVHYVTTTNFLYNPLVSILPKKVARRILARYPYEELSGDGRSCVQNAVLSGRAR